MSALTPRESTTAVRRLLKLWRGTSAADRAAGLSWYAQAQDAAAQIWPERPDLAAGVIAALSPRCQWVTNVAWSAAVVTAARTGQPCPEVSMTNNRTAAWRIANGEAPLDVMRGPKVTRFYRNIMRDYACATVDVWVVRAAMPAGDARVGKDGAIGPPLYRDIESAIQRAAQIAGVTAAQLQAVCWVAIRGRAA